ncbi:hypothetical protein SVAN01_00774 [Stagonosporopsis vannaccii]|nr:hypothetical protein SVAN01_00774 [Stagonosporopsis vannaccii]
MSETNDTQEEASSPHRNWYGADSHYPSGMTWDRSMFPATKRDENLWGPQHPVELVPPAGPFDKEDGEESWRVSSGGRDIYTGDVHIRGQAPDVRQQELQTQFWKDYEARMAHNSGDVAQGCKEQESDGAEQFPDALSTLSGTTRTSVAPNNATQQVAAPASVPDLALRPPQQLYDNLTSQVHHYSEADGEYKVNEEDLADAPVVRAIAPNAHNDCQVPDSTSRKNSSPRGIDDWDNDNLLSFYKFKVIRKKGYEPMLEHFPGQTIESLREVWKTHRKRCEKLGDAWRVAGKPKGSVAEWLHE